MITSIIHTVTARYQAGQVTLGTDIFGNPRCHSTHGGFMTILSPADIADQVYRRTYVWLVSTARDL